MMQRKERSEEEIASRAFELYSQRGGEHGKDVEDWLRAERELRDEPATQPSKPKAAHAGRQAVN